MAKSGYIDPQVQSEAGVAEFTPAQLKQLKTLDFNRKLRPAWITSLAQDIKATGESPPVMEVGNYKGSLFIIDGQHRVFACLEALHNAFVRIRSYKSIEQMREAVDKYRKIRRHTTGDVINIGASASNKQILELAKVYPSASVVQIRTIMTAIKNTQDGYTDPELRFAQVILETLSKDKRFIALNATGDDDERKRVAKTRGSVEAAFSSNDTLFCLTKFCKPHLKNLIAVKSRLRTIMDGDWNKKTAGSFRALQGAANRKELLSAMEKFWNAKG